MAQNKATLVSLESAARKYISRGVHAIYDPVRLTLGPQGGNALLYGTLGRRPRITNDGRAIAATIEPLNPYVRMAAEEFKGACDQTNFKAGDGTTTTSVIGGKQWDVIDAKLSEGSSTIGGGNVGVMSLKREMQDALKLVLAEIDKRRTKITTLEELERIAVIAVEDEKLGKEIAGMAWDVGVDGFIDVVEGYKGEIERQVLKGMRIPAKPAAKGFVNNPARFEMIAEDFEIFVTNHKLDNPMQVANVINALIKKHPKILIFAPEFNQEVITDFFNASFSLQNGVKMKKSIQIYPVSVPSLRTESLEDLAVYTGARFINKETGKQFANLTEKDLGWAGKVVVKDVDVREDASIIDGGGAIERTEKVGDKDMPVESPVTARINILKAQIEETKEEMPKKILQRRIASMSSAAGVIRVGSPSNSETTYSKLKIEDAVYACKAALQEGFVKGGGLCLKEIAETLEPSILTEALKAPYEQIQRNAGGELEIPNTVIDPAKVVRLALEHAISVVSNLATVKIIVTEDEELGPGEGYSQIARAIWRGVQLWGKQQGLIRENQDEFDKDMEDRMSRAAVAGEL